MPVKIQLFDQLRKQVTETKGLVPKEKEAQFWLRNYMRDVLKWQRQYSGLSFQKLASEKFSKQFVVPGAALPGSIYFFLYDAKYKDTLPYYDRFPFTLVLSREKDGSFLGLNMHYLDYATRARFFDSLYPFREGRAATPDVRDLRMRIKVSYDILQLSKKFAPFRACIKKYLPSHCNTYLMKVSAREWNIALFLPVEKFTVNKQRVWTDSLKKF